MSYEKPLYEINGIRLELQFFKYDEKQILNAKFDFEAKSIFYHVLDSEIFEHCF